MRKKEKPEEDMKPMIKYRGGKSREIPAIMWNMPRFTGRYVEPFFGGGALFFHIEPREAIINDINAPLMAFYKGVRDDYERVREELDALARRYDANRKEYEARKREHPEERVEDANEALYYALRDMYNGKRAREYSGATIYYFINKTAYSGMIRYNANGEFNVPYGRYKHISTENVTLSHSLLLRRAELYNGDYADVFNLCREGDFVFLDPPYECAFSDYGNEQYRDGFDERSHRRLAEDFRNLPCKAMMVISRTKLTEELYGSYIVEEYAKEYAVNIRNRFKSTANHVIVTNYRKAWSEPSIVDDAGDCRHQAETIEPMLFEDPGRYGKSE